MFFKNKWLHLRTMSMTYNVKYQLINCTPSRPKTKILCRMPKKFRNTAFLFLVIYYIMNIFTGKLHGCITHLIFLNILHHFNRLAPATNKSMYRPTVPIWFCTHSHVFTSSITSQWLPNLSHEQHLWRLETDGNLREQDLWCTVAGEEQSTWILWLLPAFSNLCVLPCWRRISATFL